MGPSTSKVLYLAVLALLCLYQPGLATRRAPMGEVAYTTVLNLDALIKAPALFLRNVTGAPDTVFVITPAPATPYCLSFSESDLLSRSGNEPIYMADGSDFTRVPSPAFGFYDALAVDGYLYLSTDHNVFKVDAASNFTNGPTANVSYPDTVSESTRLIHLRNTTHDQLVVSWFTSTSLMVIDLNNFGSNTKVIPGLVDQESGPTASVSNGGDKAYYLYSNSSAVTIGRSVMGVYTYDPIIVINGVYGDLTSRMYFDATDNILYALVQDFGLTKPILMAFNMTTLDDGTGVHTFAVPVAKRAGTYGDEFRWVAVEDPDNVVPTGTGLAVDEVGGQIFVMLQTGLVMRVNMRTMELVLPSYLANSGDISNGGGAGIFFIGDDTSSMGHRSLVTLLKDSIVTGINMNTACPNDCGEGIVPPNGVCQFGTCVCNAGRHGADCSGQECTSDCGAALGQGSCGTSGQCQCLPNWTFASNCTERQCPSNCFNNGDCNTADFTCSCSPLWAGANCSIAAFLACDTFTTQENCVAKLGACGWCADTKVCQSGNLDGPFRGTCRAWYAGGKYQVGLLVAAIIVIIIFFLMMFTGIFSAMPMDYVTASILIDSSLLTKEFLKEGYWRDERSAKTWKMFDLFQFISFYTFINVSFPTQLIQFSRYFNWANLMLPLPYGYADNKITHPNRLPSANTPGSNVVARGLLNVEQYENTVKLNNENIFYGTMFWFAMLVCACMLVYGIYALVMWLFLRKKEPNITTVLIQKVFYLLTRLVLIGYMPINFTAAWHIREGNRSHRGSIAAAVFAIIIFGILPIAFNAVVVWNKGQELLFLYLKLRFGALYSTFYYQKARFNLIVLLKKLAIALLLGFIAAPSTTQGKYVYAQVFTIVAVFAIYLILLLIIRPYLDQVHLVLDLVMTTLFAIAFGVAVMHKSKTSTAAMVVAAVCYILIFIACILAFAHSWYNIVGRNTYPWIMCGPKYSGLDEKENEDDEELDTAAAIKKKKQKEADVAGAMPSNKAAMAQGDDDTSEVDSSLQSSSGDDEEEEPQAAEDSEQQESSQEEDSESSEEADEDED